MAEYCQPSAIFVADAPGLDFLNSIATPVDQPYDWISDGHGLLDWLKQAHLVDQATLAALDKSALPGEMDKVAEQARELREWFRAFVRKRMGKPLPPTALGELAPLNRLLERNEGYSRLEVGAKGIIDLNVTRRWRSPETLLQPIGETLAKFVCDEAFSNVKACEGHSCTLLFADHTRQRSRRWCSMAICGNRAKQAAHRNRRAKSLQEQE